MKQSTLKYIREFNQVTQDELAQELGISKSTISMYENGNRTPDATNTQRISSFFKVPTTFIRGEGVFSNWFEYEPYLYQVCEQVNLLSNIKVYASELQLLFVVLNSFVKNIAVNKESKSIQIYLMFPGQKVPPTTVSDDGQLSEFMSLFSRLTPEQKNLVVAQIKGILANQ